MFIKDIRATVFKSNLKGTEKSAVRNLSIANGKDQQGNNIYESWTGYFGGKAKAKLEELGDKDRLYINITSGNASPGYNKERKQNYPNIRVTGFEVIESNASSQTTKASDPVVEEDDLPDVDW